MKIKVLCIGDIVGRPGRHVLSQELERFVSERNIDCVIANAENAAGGSGLTGQIYEKLLRYGVHLLHLGIMLIASGRSYHFLRNETISFGPRIFRCILRVRILRFTKPEKVCVLGL